MFEFDREFSHTNLRKFDTLFARDKRGKIIVFQCECYETSSKKGLIITKTGGYGNRLISKKTNVLSGKNIGKSNATTVTEQTILEATSLWNQKKTEGYKSLKDLEKFGLSPEYNGQDVKYWLDNYLPTFNTDHNNRPKPMLAEKWKQKNSYPCYIQPKYNGVRCMSFLDENDNVIMLSREGTEYDVVHVKPEIEKSLLELSSDHRFILDGELYCHGKPLNEIVSLARTGGLLGLEIYYVVYDIVRLNTYYSQGARIDILNSFKRIIQNNYKSIQVAPTLHCKHIDDVYKAHSQNIKDGFEGSILRPIDAKYYFGFRDKALQKIKETISDEFVIVGTDLKSGANIEDFVWVCITKEGKHFEVRPHGTVKERQNWFNTREFIIGKKLQLVFHEYTKEKFPFHITDVVIRDYE